MAPHLMKRILFFAALATCTNAAAILLSLLKELQKQSQDINHLAGISSQWCSDAEHQDLGIAQVIQGQLDDATIAVQQIKSDEKRLGSELALAKSTQQQREQQLQDATSTSKFAAAEFASEQSQLNKTVEACQHGITLLNAEVRTDDQQQEQLGNADLIVNNLLQTSSDHMTDDEKNIMMQYAGDPKPAEAGPTGERPQELLKTLSKLHDRLQKEQVVANSEQQVLSNRLWSFTDHLSSSIMESKSQTASITMEMAQRKRERTRLDGKISALNVLRGDVESSQREVASACSLDVNQRSQIEKYIAEESDFVRRTLKEMPTLSSELLFDLNTVLPAAPTITSFLQIKGREQHKAASKLRSAVDPILKDLRSMENKFTEDSSFFVNAEQQLIAHRKASSSVRSSQDKTQVDGIKGFASNSIQDIYAFLKSDDQGSGSEISADERMLLSSSGDLKTVTGLYRSLLDHVHAKERIVDDQLKWCSSIARDAKLDSDAVARSLKWTEAKLNLVRVATSEYERSVSFDKQQEDAIVVRSAQLQKLNEVQASELQTSYDALKQYDQQLLSMVSELEQKSSVEERKGAEVLKSLLDKVAKHQELLQQWRLRSQAQRKAVRATFDNVRQDLADDAKQSSSRLVRLKVEWQVLESLVSSKKTDSQLSHKYVQLSQQLCAGDKAQQLQKSGSKLRDEASAIQKSLSTLV